MTPLRILDVVAPGRWPRPAADHITLDYDGRRRRRIVLTSEHGARMLLDLPEAVSIPHGAGLKLEDGRLVEVIAEPEALLEVRAFNPEALMRLIWHVGNRHLACQIEADRILIRRDHVIAQMLTGLGAVVAEVVERFDPEGGAYGGAHQEHDHSHSHGHEHHHHDHHDHHHPQDHDHHA